MPVIIFLHCCIFYTPERKYREVISIILKILTPFFGSSIAWRRLIGKQTAEIWQNRILSLCAKGRQAGEEDKLILAQNPFASSWLEKEKSASVFCQMRIGEGCPEKNQNTIWLPVPHIACDMLTFFNVHVHQHPFWWFFKVELWYYWCW